MFSFEKVRGYENDNNVIIPKRSTKGSVGYDFFAPYSVEIKAGETIKINTFIKAKIPQGYWLGVYGRSSALKTGLQNYLGVGVVDSDYYGNEDNDGAISVALQNLSGRDVFIRSGERIAQGIFQRAYFSLDEEEVTAERTGGFGSTGK